MIKRNATHSGLKERVALSMARQEYFVLAKTMRPEGSTAIS
ncbi:hypothetical protein [Methylocapsa acidiphila]|nr:hypothetical protein [Methylocapsa acidiphila]